MAPKAVLIRIQSVDINNGWKNMSWMHRIDTEEQTKDICKWKMPEYIDVLVSADGPCAYDNLPNIILYTLCGV